MEVLEAWRSIRETEQLYDLLFREVPLSHEELSLRRDYHRRRIEEIRAPAQPRPALTRHPQFQSYLADSERRAEEQVELEKRVWALTVLEVLPIALRRRLALSVLVKVARHWHLESFRRGRTTHIEAVLADLALPLLEQSARQWRRNLRPYSVDQPEVWLRAPREAAVCTLWADSGGAHGALSLPLGWFTDVWARGIALVDGCFVLEVMPGVRRRGRLDVVALRWERRDRELSRAMPVPAIVLHRGGHGWRLGWSANSPTAPA
jgi:hypothetical protein